MSDQQIHPSTLSRPGHLPQTVTTTRTSKPRALILAAKGAGSVPLPLRKKLESVAGITCLAVTEQLDRQSFVILSQPYEYLAITRRAIQWFDRPVIEALPRLKGISVYSTGLEWADLECLRERGIRLLSLPGYCTNAVAETALGLMLMTAHKLHLRYLKSTYVIPESVSLRGFELKKCAVGIIGYGRIGRSLAQKVQPLCREVLACDTDAIRFSSPLHGIKQVSREQLLSRSDFVVVCASQTFEAQSLLAPEDYGLLHPDTVVINVARTSLLNHDLLVRMTKRRQIRAYIYDDLMREADRPDEMEFGKIIPTGHTAWYTDQAIENGTHEWLENLVKLCKTA